jgi:hypothetical protein
MNKVDKGGSGWDKVFWEDVAVDFSDYSKENDSGEVLVITSANIRRMMRQSKEVIRPGMKFVKLPS